MTEDRAATFARFMALVETSTDKAACWPWRGNKPGGRHGHFSLGQGTVKAHRWMYEAIVGPIPEGLVVRHRCDNPPCVNPLHLEVGTSADNARDRSERGRAANRQGENHPLAKLTAPDVIEIRRLASMGHTQAAISERFGVRRGQIGKIVTRINWRHV